MHWNNNATRIRREILVGLVKLMDQGRLEQGVDRIPFDMTPKGQPSVRCCVHHDRAILRLRLLARMGLRIEELKDEEEHLPLSHFARRALERTRIEEPVMTVIDEACHACVQSRIFVTNACQGCMARPCMVNCPKKAIAVEHGKAVIDDDLCVNCGICVKACSYGAILKIPVPCEEACPVGAISKGADGREAIDFEACVSCGACIAACPFGAVTDRSQIVDVVGAMARPGRDAVALVAPAVLAQFRAPVALVLDALRRLGFAGAWEVARGAEETARREAEELEDLIDAGGPALSTSCCPAWVEAGVKHLGWRIHGAAAAGAEANGAAAAGGAVAQGGAGSPGAAAVVLSGTPSPMVLTARMVRDDYRRRGLPEPVLVFVGPCVAKRVEALRGGEVDFVLSSEELGALLIARDVELADCADAYPAGQDPAGEAGRGFAASGGVARAVLGQLRRHAPEAVAVRAVDGLTPALVKELRKSGAGQPCHLLEGMACAGGCVCGPSILVNPKIAQAQLKKG